MKNKDILKQAVCQFEPGAKITYLLGGFSHKIIHKYRKSSRGYYVCKFKIRLWNPFNWFLFLVVFIVGIFDGLVRAYKEIVKACKDGTECEVMDKPKNK